MPTELEWNHLTRRQSPHLTPGDTLLTNICAHSDDAASESNIGALTSGTATARPVLVSRIESTPNDVVHGFTNHQTLRHARLDVKHGAGFTKQRGQHRVLFVVLSEPGDITHRRLEPFDSELVLQRDWQTM